MTHAVAAAHPTARGPAPVRTRTAERQDAGWRLVTRCTAATVAVLLGTNIVARTGLTVGAALAVGLAPVWIGAARRYRGASTLGLLLLACMVAGPLLTAWASDDHAGVHSGTKAALLTVLSTGVGVGALLWARDHLSLPVMMICYGAGAFATATHSGRYGEDHWRFGFAFPTVVLTLGVCLLFRSRLLEIIAVAALATVTAASGARSMSASLLMAGVLALWMLRPRAERRSTSAALSLGFVAGLAFGVYKSLEAAALDGYLGLYAQQRTQSQIEQSGSLLLGGRPEAGATWALMHDNWPGFGTGTAPNSHDILVAKAGMSRLGYDANNGYVERYMMGSRIELHSLIGDLWVWFGAAGIALAVALLIVALRYIGHSLAAGTGTVLGLYLAVDLIWNMFFSPLQGSFRYLDFALAMILLPVAAHHPRRRPGPDVDEGRPAAEPETAQDRRSSGVVRIGSHRRRLGPVVRAGQGHPRR